jgi:hypothetical protein
MRLVNMSIPTPRAGLACALLCLSTIGTPRLEAQVRVVPAELQLQFGGLQDDPTRDLYHVRRVVRTGDGRFVVATSKPVGVRVYSARGVIEQTLGREGEGPGEYRFAADLGMVTGDSVRVVSYGTRRWMEFELTGRLLREYPVDEANPIPGGMSLQHGHYARHRVVGQRGCAPEPLLARFAPSRPLQFVEVVTDGSGRTWRHDVATPGLWHIHTSDGIHRFDVRLPPGFTIHQFAGDQVIGVAFDDDDAHHVIVYRVVLPAPAGPPPAPCAFPPPSRDGVFRNLQIHARNAMTAGAALRSDLRRYPATVEEMARFLNVTQEAEMRILHSSEESWVVAISHLESGAVCVASIGPRGLAGWESGTIACSPTGGTRRSR